MKIVVIGPGYSGKSTLCRLLAEHLGIPHIDSGLFFRAITYAARDQGVSFEDEHAISGYAESLHFTLNGNAVLWDGQELGESALKSPEINTLVPMVAAYPQVRDVAVRMVSEAAAQGACIIGGRSPDEHSFDKLIWLTAEPAVRAERYKRELEAKGQTISLREAEETLKERDERDSVRSASPMYCPGNALVVDTTGRTPKEVVEQLCDLVS